jgi:predicted transposase YdaD
MEGLQEGRMEGLQEGRMEGLQEGRIEGRMEGSSAILLRLLAKRFGPDILDRNIEERLRAAGPEQLDLWAERILDAGSVDEVFAE